MTIHRSVSFGALVIVCFAGLAAPLEAAARLWTPMSSARPVGTVEAAAQPATRWSLDLGALNAILARAPMENTTQARTRVVELTVPSPDGRLQRFRIVQSPVFAPALARRYPKIRTYAGTARDGSGATLRFSRTPLGFQAIVLAADGAFFVEPIARGETRVYQSYRGSEMAGGLFDCETASSLAARLPSIAPSIAASGANLRTYRLAVAATGEYTQFFGSQANALAGIAATVSNVNAIYNRDIAVRLVVIANDDQIVFTDPTTDPFPLVNLNAEVQAAIDSTIGDANYDVGHVFHASGFSGNAGCIACVCVSGSKGSGFSQDATPNDGDFTFLVAHEMGHQHGGSHTFNGSNCNPGQYTASSAWEPGSGSTIMSYSSICGADNVLGGQVGDLYFHAGSRQQITTYTGSGGGTACGTSAATGNGAPTVSAGADYTIPRGTPFVLTASGSDPDGNPLTFTWEQFDLGPTAPLSAVDDGAIPLFRSRPPTSSAARTFPLFADLLAGSANLFPNKLGEQLPSTDRNMTFRTTGRDNQQPVGGANDDEMEITVAGDPFVITTPSGSETLECGVANTVEWTVGGGSVAPTVDIKLSVNGGTNFPFLLAGGTANDGSQSVAVPATLTSDARVRIDSVGNIFFNVSDATPIVDTLDPTVVCPQDVTVECRGQGCNFEKNDPQLAAFFAGASASDACDAAPVVTNNAPDCLTLGDNVVTFTATDASGNSGTCQATIHVVDTTAPQIGVSVTPTVLWPPNHKLVEITAHVVVTDTCDPAASFVLTSITSNEPDNGGGDGNTVNDIQGAAFGTADTSFLLRAERSGQGSGRVYTIVYTAQDQSGNTAQAVARVFVPHDQGH